MSPRIIDQVPTHGSSSYSEEMRPALPIPIFRLDQPEVDLVDQFRGLQRVAFAFPFHEIVRQTLEIRHYERKKIVFRVTIAISPSPQKVGDVARIGHGLAAAGAF